MALQRRCEFTVLYLAMRERGSNGLISLGDSVLRTQSLERVDRKHKPALLRQLLYVSLSVCASIPKGESDVGADII